MLNCYCREHLIFLILFVALTSRLVLNTLHSLEEVVQAHQLSSGRHRHLFHGTPCFIQKIYAPSSSLLQGKHLPFSPSPLRLNIFCLFVILSLTQLYRYTPDIFLFSTATFKYKYRSPLRRIEQEYSAKVAFSIFQSLKRIQPLPVCAGFFICIRNSLDRPCVTMPS